MSIISTKSLAALVAGCALAVAGCGDDDDKAGSASVKGGNGIDRAFVAGMIPHHESAIEMATIAQRRGESAFVKKLAADILASQKKEIDTMRREDEALETAGIERGSLGISDHMEGMEAGVKRLETVKPFDEAFLKLMIPHHEDALPMAKIELDKGEDPELKALAQEITDEQTREIAEMRKHLADAGGSGDDAMEDHGSTDSGHG